MEKNSSCVHAVTEKSPLVILLDSNDLIYDWKTLYPTASLGIRKPLRIDFSNLCVIRVRLISEELFLRGIRGVSRPCLQELYGLCYRPGQLLVEYCRALTKPTLMYLQRLAGDETCQSELIMRGVASLSWSSFYPLSLLRSSLVKGLFPNITDTSNWVSLKMEVVW